MISLDGLRVKILECIQKLEVPQLNKLQLAVFKQYCLDIMQDSDVSILLSLIVSRVNMLSDPMNFLEKVTLRIQDIVKPHLNNELKFALGEHFEPEEGIDQVSKESIQSIFIKNLISILNMILVKSIGDIPESQVAITPDFSKKVQFSDDIIMIASSDIGEHAPPKFNLI